MDRVDYAAQREQLLRDTALNRHQQRRRDVPVVIGGRLYCIDCGDPIPAARRAARVDAIRCLECQTVHEHQQKGRPGQL